MKKNKNAFTLVEVIVAILIISIVLISWFQLFSLFLASKVKLTEQLKLEKNVFYFSEKIFSLIKKWGTLDYEEYFNRRVVWDERMENWHFLDETWFWNFWKWWQIWTDRFWNGFYYCVKIWTDEYQNFIWTFSNKWYSKWCLTVNSSNSFNKISKNQNSVSENQLQEKQRYWQYSYQFIDYNSDWNNDNWDSNKDGNIVRDDDDKHLWYGPEVFESWTDVKELYLISWDKKKRTYFRWNLKQDELFENNSSKQCDINPSSENFKYCRWTIEFLELEWKDWGLNHDWLWEYANDWVIDTWLIDSDFSWKTNINKQNSIIVGTLKKEEMDKIWKPLFSDDINISDFKVFAYPNIDSSKVWDITQDEQNKYLISPYVILSFEVKPSWRVKRKIQWDIKPIKFNTTINLTEIFSK